MKKQNVCKVGKLSTPLWVLLLVLPIVTAIIALGVGRLNISPLDVIRSIGGRLSGAAALSQQNEIVLWNIRLPRILLSALVGAGLSVSGCAFQSLFSNPLATPDTVGVASGTCFGAVLAILMGFGIIGTQFVALAFGIIAVALTYIAGKGKGNNLNSIVLAGIMIGSLFTALISLVKFTADTESQLPAITFWLMGSFASAGYKSLSLGAPMIITGIFVLFLLRWRMNILLLSEDEAKATGTNIKALRAVTVICATAITASCVSMCGQVGWVGLLVPHMCRMKFGNNHLSLLPASISFGAVFMIIVDTAARTMTAAEIPVSVLTAIIGAPFFIILMRKTGGWQL